MIYNRTHWINNHPPALNEDNLNNIEDGISRLYEHRVEMVTEYTVAAEGETNPEDFDFPNLEAAMSFAETVSCVGGGVVVLQLADGTHYFRRNPKQPDVAGNSVGAYNYYHTHIFLSGSSKDNCILKIDPSIDIDEGGTLIRTGNSKIAFWAATIDLQNADNKTVHFLRAHNSYLYFGNTKIIGPDKNQFCTGVWSDGECFIYQYQSELSGWKYAVIVLGGASSGRLPAITDSYCGVFDVTKSSSFVSENNSADIPIANSVDREITSAGGIVDLGVLDAPATIAGWVGTTVDRPNMPAKAYATPYFDTDLGHPIWWNGTAWVDATGTNV